MKLFTKEEENAYKNRLAIHDELNLREHSALIRKLEGMRLGDDMAKAQRAIRRLKEQKKITKMKDGPSTQEERAAANRQRYEEYRTRKNEWVRKKQIKKPSPAKNIAHHQSVTGRNVFAVVWSYNGKRHAQAGFSTLDDAIRWRDANIPNFKARR